MPGYRILPPELTGPGTEEARAGEHRQHQGDLHGAARCLEAALAAMLQDSPVIPRWIVGRLAALYRALERYDDEVDLLERFKESQGNGLDRTRYEARLSKARAIAHRKRRQVTGAHASIRRVLTRTRQPERAEVSTHAGDIALRRIARN